MTSPLSRTSAALNISLAIRDRNVGQGKLDTSDFLIYNKNKGYETTRVVIIS